MTALVFVLECLAAYRLFRLLAVDDFPPIVPLRLAVVDAVTEWLGEDWADGVTCPWCLGAWISFAVVAWTDYLIHIPVPLLQALAVSCVVGLIGGVDG